MVCEFAIVQGWLGVNPCAETVFPALIERDYVYLTAAEVDRLAELCGPQGDVVLILAYTGLRWGELAGLRVEDVDLTARRLRVRRSITQVGGKLVEGPPKTRAGRRTVAIPRRVIPVLAARIEGRAGSEPAICAPRGGVLSRENWVRDVKFKASGEQLGRRALRIHDLRHTYASLARSAGADLTLLQKSMGHSSITTTAHTYAGLYDGDLDRVADAMDRAGEGGPSGVVRPFFSDGDR